MKNLALASVVVVACGGAAAPPVVTVAPVPTTSASASPQAADRRGGPITLVPAFEATVHGDVRGIALERGRLYVEIGDALSVFDAHGPVAAASSTWKPGDPLVVVGDGAFDPASFHPHAPALRAGLACDGRAFSYDASRMSVYCQGASNDAVHVVDVRTGAEVGVFSEFQTAAPIRTGSITASGHFVFWESRASGAFEEIKSHVTGPVISSHSVMSRDETMVFTTVDRRWYTEDESPAQVIDPRNGRARFELDRDVETVFFSPSSRLFAARHSANWADLEHAKEHDRTHFTIHGDGPAVLARVPGPEDDAVLAAFAPDDSAIAVAFARGVVSVYSIRR